MDLSYTNVIDVNCLGQGKVQKLNLSFCRKVVNVSGLVNITNLKLVGCRRIVDVSMLGNVSSLDIRGCWRIKNVHKLTNKKLIYNYHDTTVSDNSNNDYSDDEFN